MITAYDELEIGDMVISKLARDEPTWWILVKKESHSSKLGFIVFTWFANGCVETYTEKNTDPIGPRDPGSYIIVRNGEILQ